MNNEYYANNISFEELCDLCENISLNIKNKTKQYNILYDYINNFRTSVCNKNVTQNKSLFPILRLLIPNCDRERPAYGLKAHTLGRLYFKLLGLSETSRDAQNLMNFRSVPGSHKSDFASVLYFVLKTRSNRNSDLTIGQINKALDRMANAETGSRSEIMKNELYKFLSLTTPKQHKWLIRIILKDMKLGISHKKLLASFHPDAPELYDNCNSLLKVCEELEDLSTRPAEIGVQLFSAVSPMMAERLDVKQILKLDINVTYHIENKFDGERFQMHMSDGVFKYFSRRGFDFTKNLGKSYDSYGLLTPFLKDVFKSHANNFVLDGEMMGWHKEKQCFGSKGMAFDVKKLNENSKHRPCFCVFDILFYNNKSLTGDENKDGALTLKHRIKILDELFVDKIGYIIHSKREIVNDREEILIALNKAIDNADEGIVIKDIDSYYIANKRNAGWFKVKPEYSDGAIEDFDLLVIGGDYAENKSLSLVKSFLVALAEKEQNGGGIPKRWLSVGRVASGLSFEEKEAFSAKLEPHWRQLDKHPAPDYICWTKVKPDLWIEPQNSCILQVKASELIHSDMFAAGYALRFPRIIKIRYDKPINDAMTTNQFSAFIKDRGYVQKLASDYITPDQIEKETHRERKKRTAIVMKVSEPFQSKKNEPINVKSNLLEGKKICVLSDDEISTKDNLEYIIKSHGGIPVQNIGKDTWCCIAGRIISRVKNAIDSSKVDIIKPDWLLELSESNKEIKLNPNNFIFTTEKTKNKLRRYYDEYGDSYTEIIDVDVLRSIFTNIDMTKSALHLTTDEIEGTDMEIFGRPSPYSYLRGCFIHFKTQSLVNSLKPVMYGATLCNISSPNLTHIIINNNSCTLFEESITYINELWLEECYSCASKLDVLPYTFVRL